MAKSQELPLNPHPVQGIKLKNDPIAFDGDCVDPYAKFVISEALDYAVETSLTRLKRAGKSGITDVETRGYPAVEIVQGIRDALEKAPSCPRELTREEKDVIATYLAREGIKGKKPKTEPKPKAEPKAEKLTPEVWNMMPVSDRALLAKKARMEGERGAVAFGSLTKEEIIGLSKAYLGPPPEPKLKTPSEPKAPSVSLWVVAKKDPKTQVVSQLGFDIRDEKGQVVKRISPEEGAELVRKGEASITGSSLLGPEQDWSL